MSDDYIGKLVAQEIKPGIYFIGMVIASQPTQFNFVTYTVEWYNLDSKFDSIYEGYTMQAIEAMLKDYYKIRRKLVKR
jgi:hypothetical protein